jgi:hypothetical protein
LLTRVAQVVGIVVGVLTILGIFFGVPDLGGGEKHVGVASVPSDPRLERVDLIAHNGPRLERIDPITPKGLSGKPAVEVIVRNGGAGRAVISRAEIKILRMYSLPLCWTQGSLPVSEIYGAQLPVDAKPGDVVEVPLHQQVGPNQADRFEIGVSAIGEVLEGKSELSGLYLFEFEVSLAHDGEETALPIGTALLSLPEVPLSSEFLLLNGLAEVNREFNWEGRPVREVWTDQMPCWQANARTAIGAAESRATMSPTLRQILDAVFVPTFAEAEG